LAISGCFNPFFALLRYDEINKRYGNKAERIIEVDELREMLEIPKSYQYSSHIKKIILNKSKKELEKHTDIVFDFEEIKTGRKITHIKFVIQGNSKKIISKNSQDVEKSKNKNEIKKKTEKGDIDFKNLKFKEFKQLLVDNYAGYYLGEYENKSITLSESGYIELDGKRVSADESFDVWEELFINRANLEPKTKEEFEEMREIKEREEKKNYLKELKKEYVFRKIEVEARNALGHINKVRYEVIDFLPPTNGEERCFDLVIKGEDGKTYKVDNVKHDEFVSYLAQQKDDNYY
jgi:plasmid replication initiation protein